jgi:carboxyl-terminal processing protease
MKSLLLIALLASPALAGHDSNDEYDEWKNKPKEAFSDPKKAFDEAREVLLKEYLDDKLTEADLYRAAVAGMLRGAAGRKWDKLLSPGEYGELMGDLGGEMVGIGIEIRFDDESGNIVILGTVPGSPAEKGELKAGDRILKIDGKSFKGMQLRDAVYGIRGKAGQPVTLTLLREDRVLTRTVVRAPITFAPVSSMMLPSSVGLVSLKAFTDKTPGLLRAALQQIIAQRPHALVVDLRMNEGGNFHKVVDCAGLFLPKDRPVATMVHRGGSEQVLKSAGENLTSGIPIVVLVNGSTASGAEMLAAALRDEGGARLVGKKTLGKWNVQKLATLSNKYAIKYTVGLFKSPKGALLDGKGLDADLEVDLDDAATEKAMHVADGAQRLKADPQLRAAVQLLRLEH